MKKFLFALFLITSVIFFMTPAPTAAATSPEWQNDSFPSDADDSQPYDLYVYNDKLYLATQSTSGTELLLYVKDGSTWSKVDTHEIEVANYRIEKMIEYHGLLTMTTWGLNGPEVWTYEESHWNQLGLGGNGDINNNREDVEALAVYDDKLYVGYNNMITGVEVWSWNGLSWAQVNDDGFGDSNKTVIDSLVVHNSTLYAGVIDWNNGNGYVYRYDGGQTWTLVSDATFIDGETGEMYLASFNGQLLLGVSHLYGARVYRYDGGQAWTQINTNGFGEGVKEVTLQEPAIYNGNLYFPVTHYYLGECQAMVRRWDGSSWTAPGPFETASTNYFVDTLEVYRGKLYAGLGVQVVGTEGPRVYSWYSVNTLPVYRFWNNSSRHHFYTISEEEKDSVILHYPEWTYEGVAYSAVPQAADGFSPVYRFWSERYRGHFYTISESEKNYVIAHYANDWAYEGVAYYAGPSVGAASVSVFRFWSNRYNSHFYTASEQERDYVIANLPHDWAYEGVAFFVF